MRTWTGQTATTRCVHQPLFSKGLFELRSCQCLVQQFVWTCPFIQGSNFTSSWGQWVKCVVYVVQMCVYVYAQHDQIKTRVRPRLTAEILFWSRERIYGYQGCRGTIAPLNVSIVLWTRVLWYWLEEVWGVILNPVYEGIKRAYWEHAHINLGSRSNRRIW